MSCAVQKIEHEDVSVKLEVQEALEAAIVRAMEVGSPKRSIHDFISKDEWCSMDASQDNILVFDPE